VAAGKNRQDSCFTRCDAIDWNDYSRKGLLRAVIDPKDELGFKNILIDRIHWDCLKMAIMGTKNLIDFGCGTGRFSKRIANLGIGYTGVDLSEGMIQVAKKHNPDLEEMFFKTDENLLPFADNSFDVCITSYVLQHFLKADNTQIFSEISRVVAPDGLVVSIEQASLCNKSSEMVGESASEADYIEKLSYFGRDISVNRIRNGNPTLASRVALHFATMLPFAFILSLLSSIERMAVAKKNDIALAESSYYDVLLIVRRNGK